MRTMEQTISHSLIYTTKGDVPVSVVAKSLLANERLIHESVSILGNCFDEIAIECTTVKVSYLSNSSPLREVLAITIFLTYQDKLEKEVPDFLEKMLRVDVPDSAEAIVTVLVMICAVYIISEAVKRLFPGKSEKKLKSEYEEKKAHLSKLTGLDPDVIEQAVTKSLNEGKSKTLVHRAIDFFRPAKLEGNTTISSDSGQEIASETIMEVPKDIDYEQLEDKITHDLIRVTVEIHRADVDYGNQGWLAVIKSQSPDRKKLILAKEFEPLSIYGKTEILGDVTVVEEKKMDGEYAIKEYFLNRIYNRS